MWVKRLKCIDPLLHLFKGILNISSCFDLLVGESRDVRAIGRQLGIAFGFDQPMEFAHCLGFRSTHIHEYSIDLNSLLAWLQLLFVAAGSLDVQTD